MMTSDAVDLNAEVEVHACPLRESLLGPAQLHSFFHGSATQMNSDVCQEEAPNWRRSAGTEGDIAHMTALPDMQ